VLKSSDGGVSWSFLPVVDGNPIYGLACPTTSVCYATDIYAHVTKTADGGATWTWQSTPVTTPGLAVPGSGGPNPFAGLFGITCVDASTCVAVGGFPPTGTDPPIVTTTDGGATWTKRTSNSGTNNYLHAVSCVPGTTTCWAVGRGGSIVTSTDLVTWTKVTSGTTSALNSIACLGASFCIASGQNGTVDIWNGTAWAVTTGLGGNVFLSGVACPAAGTCFIAGKQGVTLATTNSGGAWAQQAGGGTTSQMNSISCTSADACVAAGAGGTVLQTTDGGQTWLARTSGTTNALNGVSCVGTGCVAVGAAGTARVSTDGGSTWAAGTSGTTQALNGVSCVGTACVAVGAAGTIIGSASGGATWAPQTSGTTTALNAVACPSATTCYAAGAVTAGSAVLVKTANGGTNWATQPSSSTQALTGVACLTSSYCFAGGAIGTVVGTSDGTTWAQQGNPLSGPTTALNTAATTLTAINAAACNATRCIMGAASSGNILTTPLLTVTVHTVSEFGTVPDLTGLAPNDPEISYSPAGEAANVTGTLSCSSTATSSSAVGTYPVSSCSGLDDDGFNIVYDYDTSNHTIVKAHQSITFAPIGDMTYGDADFDAVAIASSGLAVSFTATGNCTISGATVHIVAAGSCTVTASQGGNGSYEPAADVARTFSIARAGQTIDFGALDDQTFGNADFAIDATATSGLPVHLEVTSGPCTLSGDTAPANAHISGAGTCVVTASQGGDSNYEPAPDVERSFAIAKAGQTITFGPLAGKTYGDADFAVSATASSGLAVTFSAAGACTVASGTVHIVSTGSCTITASQAGDDNWNPAPDVSQSFDIAKERTVTAYTGFTGAVLNGTTIVLSGTLRADGGPVIAGRTLTFTLGSGATAQRCLATTNGTGSASCSVTVNQTPGAKPVAASFAGDSLYLPSASAEGTASVFTANSLMQDVLAQLQALSPGASKQDGDKLDDAVKKLTDALDPSLWVDGNRVDGQHGDRVFDRSRDAVGKLMDLLKKGSIPAATVQSLIDELVQADRILAEGAVADAIAAPAALHRVGEAGKGPKKHDLDKIAQAQQELAKAADEVAAGNFDNAIEHYRNAWKKAEDALR
jgi:photosystem II stability/assembly factor-like uncharacterized protein